MRTFLAVLVVCLLLCLSLAAESNSDIIEQLKKDVANGDAQAVSRFWDTIRQRHAPIVEADSSSSEKLVTFVWQGDENAKTVLAITPLSLVDIKESELTHIPNSDVWYQTYRMPNDARFTYRLAINDSEVPFEKEANFFVRMKDWKRDPLNPNTFEVFPGVLASAFALPGAPSDEIARPRPDVPKGAVSEQTFASKRLGLDVKLWIYTPASNGAHLPAVIFNDGDSYKDLMSTPVILDNMIADRAIPPIIAAFVANPENGRDEYLNCSSDWSYFEATELMDWLQTQYHVASDAAQHVIAGFSLGRLAAGCAAVSRPEVFGKVLVQSGSFYRAPEGETSEWLARQIASKPLRQQQWYVEVGLLETAVIPSRDPSMLTASRHLRDVLRARGYQVSYAERYNGHEHFAWRATLPIGLRKLFTR